MKCSRCRTAPAMKHSDLCGICEIVTSPVKRFGVQTSSLVPKHWNAGLGEDIEDYDHLKRRRKELVREGVLESDGWE